LVIVFAQPFVIVCYCCGAFESICCHNISAGFVYLTLPGLSHFRAKLGRKNLIEMPSGGDKALAFEGKHSFLGKEKKINKNRSESMGEVILGLFFKLITSTIC